MPEINFCHIEVSSNTVSPRLAAEEGDTEKSIQPQNARKEPLPPRHGIQFGIPRPNAFQNTYCILLG